MKRWNDWYISTENEWNEWLADNHCEAVFLFLEFSIRKNPYMQNTQKEQSFKIVLWRFIDVVFFLVWIIENYVFIDGFMI